MLKVARVFRLLFNKAGRVERVSAFAVRRGTILIKRNAGITFCSYSRSRGCSPEERRALSLMRNCVQAGCTAKNPRQGFTSNNSLTLLAARRNVKKIVSPIVTARYPDALLDF